MLYCRDKDQHHQNRKLMAFEISALEIHDQFLWSSLLFCLNISKGKG